MEYNFEEIEKKWQKFWNEHKIYKTEIDHSRPKYYVLDMFPYPSGAGLHVGHPLGYIASDIFSRYKRMKGFNVLHPMGFDAFGLPAEQYAIQTGQHPAITTEQNIKRYREQLDKIGFNYDWDREVQTCDPDYYLWTQWAFVRMFESYYHLPPAPSEGGGGARAISELVEYFEKYGTENLNVAQTEELHFTADEWKKWDEKKRQEILLNYRLAYLADTMVNWCPALGTVLANDEVSEGFSIRGGHPVEQRLMKQWCLRVSAYAQRLLEGLEKIDWTESLKETQRNWVGRSEGAEIYFISPPQPPPKGGEGFRTARVSEYLLLKSLKKEKLKHKVTEAENFLWENLRGKHLEGYKFRREHIIDQFIVDFVCLSKRLVIEIDGGYHNEPEIISADKLRTRILNSLDFTVIRFTNEEVLNDIENVLRRIKETLLSPSRSVEESLLDKKTLSLSSSFSPPMGGGGGGFCIFTTRPDTIFGATFMVLAPESEYVYQITSPEKMTSVNNYLEAVKRRTERERIADRRVTGVFSGSYAINPFTEKEIPIWISDYVLAGYGTGAIMAVPAHDSRDYAFAKHFNLPIIQLIEGCEFQKRVLTLRKGL